MAGLEIKSADAPDEKRDFPNGSLGVLTMSGLTLGKAEFRPGWRWSNDVAPIAGTPSCQVHHNGYVISGRMHMVMDDGSEAEVGPGDVFVCPPGHDAWTVGDEPVVVLDFASGMQDYAKPS